MIKFFVHEFLNRWVTVESAHAEWTRRANAGGNAGLTLIQPRDELELERISSAFAFICSSLSLTDASRQYRQFYESWKHMPCPYYAVSILMGNLIQSIKHEADSKMLVVIPSEKTGTFQRDELFGPLVSTRLPEAATDIQNAGNCLATDLNTAAVFYLMRVVEHGLIKLAKKLGATTKFPLEYEQWDGIIKALEVKVKEVVGTKRGQKKDDDEDFYMTLLFEFNYFKDVWRNRVSHGSRGTYDAQTAKEVFNHVKAFTERLVTRLPNPRKNQSKAQIRKSSLTMKKPSLMAN